jgi:regulator of protease activity HflC (stomatin/prohibitin superfamily)
MKKMVAGSVVLFVLIVAFAMWGVPRYNIYERRLNGEAELARAEFERRTIVVTAEAKKDAARLEGEAEVARAHGLAEANKIIGESLSGHDDYLRYLWIQALAHQGAAQIVYVPTEGGLPVLEAVRLKNLPERAK